MKSYNYLDAQDIDRENLINNDDFLDDAATYIYKRTDGKVDLTEPEEIYDEFMKRMRYHDVNELDTVSDLMYAQEADDESKQEMARLFDVYDRMEMSTEDFGDKVLDYGTGIITAPSTGVGLLTGGGAKVASFAGQQATKAIVRRALSSALKAGAIEAGIGAVQNVGQQATRMEIDPEREFSGSELALTAGLSALPGVVIGGAQGARRASMEVDAFKLEQEATQALARAQENGVKNAQETLAKADDVDLKEVDQVIEELNPLLKDGDSLDPLDPLRVARGEELKADIAQVEGFEIRLSQDKVTQLKAAVLDMGTIIGRRKGERITSALSRAIADGDVPQTMFADIMEKYNLNGVELGLVLEADVSNAARLMNAMGQIKKSHYKFIKNMVEDAKKISDETGIGRESSNFKQELAVEGNISRMLGTLNNIERVRRSAMTSQPVTTVRNFFGGGARLTLDAFEDFITASTHRLYNKLVDVSPKAIRDAMGLQKVTQRSEFNSADIAKYIYNRPEADLIVDMYRNIDKEGYEKFFQGFIDASQGSAKIQPGIFNRGLTAAGNALNYFNKLSDNFYKKAAFSGELSRLTKAHYGMDLTDMIRNGQFNKIDPKLFNEAMDKAFELLYQKTPKGTGWLAQGARGYLNFDKRFGFVSGLLIPFPRFVINQIQFMYEHVPLLGMLPLEAVGAKGGTMKALKEVDYGQKFAKTISGSLMIGAFYSLRKNQGAGTEWYNAETEDGRQVDLRPFLGPMNLDLYLADLIMRHKAGEPMPMPSKITKEMVQTAIGSSMRAGTGLYLIDQGLPELLATFDGEKPTIRTKEFFGRLVGDYLNTYTINLPVAVARDLYSLTDEQLRLIPETKGEVDTLDIAWARAGRSLGPFQDNLEPRYDIFRPEPTRKVDPLRTAITGLNISQRSNEVEKEMTRLQLEPFEIYRGFKFGPADVEIRRVMSQRLPQIMSAFIRRDEYKNLPSDERKTIEFIRYAKEQIGEILRKPRSGGEAPVLEVLEARVQQLEEQGASQDAIKEELGYHRNDINQFLYENSQKRIRRAVEEELGAPTDESNFAEYYARAQDLTKQKFATGGMPTPMDEQMDALSLSETLEEQQAPDVSVGEYLGMLGDLRRGITGGAMTGQADMVKFIDDAIDYVRGQDADLDAPLTQLTDATLGKYGREITGDSEIAQASSKLIGENLGVIESIAPGFKILGNTLPEALGIFGDAKRAQDKFKRYEEAMAEPPRAGEAEADRIERIRQETGVGVLEGADSTPRFEIDDSKAKIKNIEVAEFQGISSDGLGEPYKQLVTKSGSPIGGGLSNLTIGDILEHDEFFKYYPEARDLPITYAGDGYKGAFIYGTDRTDPLGSGAKMELSSDVDPESFLSPLADLRETVLHELQHYVQFVDNLNMGGSSKTFMPGGNTFGMARLGEEIDTKLDGVYRAITNRQDELMPEIFDLIVAGLGSPNAKTVANAENIAKNNKITEDEMIVIRHLADLKKDFNKIETEAYMNYRTLSGEIEARLISEQRRAMTPEERIAQRPSLPERLLAEETLGMKEGRYPVKNNPVVLAMEEGSVNKEYISRLGMMRDQATKLISRMKGSEFFDFNDDGGFKLLDSIEINIDNSISNVIDKAKDKGFIEPAVAKSEVIDSEGLFKAKQGDVRRKRIMDLRQQSRRNELPEEFGGFRLDTEVDVPGYGPGKIGQINYNKAGEPSIMVALNRDEAPIAVGMSVSEALEKGVKITKEAPVYTTPKVKVDSFADPYAEFAGLKASRDLADIDDPELVAYYKELADSDPEEYQKKVIDAYRDAWLERTGKKPNTEVTKRNTIMENAAKKVKEGELDVQEFRVIADQQKPVKVWESLPEMATFEDMFFALDAKKSKSPFIGYNKRIEDGTKLSVRLDIPAYTRFDTWVLALKGPKDVHSGMMYAPAVRLKNVDMTQTEKQLEQAMDVAAGKAKGPFAVMEGNYVEETAEDTYKLAEEALNSDEWIQVGFDPTRRGYFYDRKTMEPVLNAEEIVQVGALVLAKKAVKGDPKDFKFNRGGLMSRK